ncbi:MAG: DUF2142 domain-containing protein [Ardenticatenaceae bacterium]|nr:DUF2142 domain-containing protein [Ardenticatenaceae bacterium]
MSEKKWLTLILLLYLLLGATYAVVTPVFEASDELWHYPMIRHLADGNPLPVQGADRVGPWKQQASQPPLYYYLSAALTFWIDTSDMEQVRWLNPHVDNGVITEDGNINLVIHDPNANQWQGTLLAVHLVRLFSVLLGGVTVYTTYLIAQALVPGRAEVVLGATAVNAFLPMFLFISGAVNNDNLVMALVGIALVMMLRLVQSKQPQTTKNWLVLGAVIGAAALAKFPGLALMFMALGTIFMVEWQQSERVATISLLLRLLGRTLLQWLIVAIPFVLIAGWWYYRNKVLYGDWLGWSAFFEVLGVRATPASLAQLWDERFGFMMSYWGLFGGVNVPMPMWIYSLLNWLVVLAVPGFGVYLYQVMKKWLLVIGYSQPPIPNNQSSITNNQSPISNLQSLIANLLNFVTRHFPLIVCLLWSIATIISLINWTTTTWSSQGRLVFAALSTLCALWLAGLVGWLPRRWATPIVAGLGVFMFAIAAAAPFLWIRPAYTVPAAPPAADMAFSEMDAVFGNQLRLLGYAVEQAAAQPGDPVWLHVQWEAIAPVDRDWSVFVHLNDPVLGRPIAQRDMYPGQGLLATQLLQPGQRWVDSYRLQLPQTAVAPATLDLTIGLYDFNTFERLPLASGQDALHLADIALEPVPGETPNPIHVNFENELTLIGFELSPRRVQPGETVSLTLYWEGQRPLTTDYTFFAQIVGEDTTRWAAQDLPVPTSRWPANQPQRVTFSLPLRDDTPANTYPIILGVYTQTADGGFDRLQTVTEDGRLTDDFFLLTLIRVD